MRYIEACENNLWTLKLKHLDTLEEWYSLFRCRSWRHEGDCRRWKNAQDFVRIRNAIKQTGDEWVYIVLTFARESFKDIWEAYRELYYCWDKLRKRFKRKWGEIKYISLVEQHRDGFPHINILVYNRTLWYECQEEGWKAVRREWLELDAVKCGFGFRTWIEPVRSEEAIAGYFVKLCGEIISKSKKVDQTPVEAPKGFRRLRASQGLLPKVYHNPRVTGKLIKMSIEELKSLRRRYVEMANIREIENVKGMLEAVNRRDID